MLSVELVTFLAGVAVLAASSITLAEVNKLTVAAADAKRAKTIKHLQIAQIVGGSLVTLASAAALYEEHSGKSIGSKKISKYLFSR